MKKICGMILTALILILPFKVYAGSATVFIATDEAMTDTSLDGGTKTFNKQSDGTGYAYLGVLVNSGTVKSYNVTVTLTNLTLVNYDKSSGWAGEVKNNNDGTITISLKNETGVTTAGGGKHLVVKLLLKAIDITGPCSLKMADNDNKTPKCQIIDNKYYGKDGVEVKEEDYYKQCYSCLEANGKYYDKDGRETTKEKYEAVCKNPQTGNFLPYFVIIVGISLAIGVYSLTRKSKIYNV